MSTNAPTWSILSIRVIRPESTLTSLIRTANSHFPPNDLRNARIRPLCSSHWTHSIKQDWFLFSVERSAVQEECSMCWWSVTRVVCEDFLRLECIRIAFLFCGIVKDSHVCYYIFSAIRFNSNSHFYCFIRPKPCAWPGDLLRASVCFYVTNRSKANKYENFDKCLRLKAYSRNQTPLTLFFIQFCILMCVVEVFYLISTPYLYLNTFSSFLINLQINFHFNQ